MGHVQRVRNGRRYCDWGAVLGCWLLTGCSLITGFDAEPARDTDDSGPVVPLVDGGQALDGGETDVDPAKPDDAGDEPDAESDGSAAQDDAGTESEDGSAGSDAGTADGTDSGSKDDSDDDSGDTGGDPADDDDSKDDTGSKGDAGMPAPGPGQDDEPDAGSTDDVLDVPGLIDLVNATQDDRAEQICDCAGSSRECAYSAQARGSCLQQALSFLADYAEQEVLEVLECLLPAEEAYTECVESELSCWNIEATLGRCAAAYQRAVARCHPALQQLCRN